MVYFTVVQAQNPRESGSLGSFAQTGVSRWAGCHPANHKVTGSIPGQGTCLGCMFCPGQGM